MMSRFRVGDVTLPGTRPSEARGRERTRPDRPSTVDLDALPGRTGKGGCRLVPARDPAGERAGERLKVGGVEVPEL